eukprot:1158683-Pelagomonas_calceolata.AAC.7
MSTGIASMAGCSIGHALQQLSSMTQCARHPAWQAEGAIVGARAHASRGGKCRSGTLFVPQHTLFATGVQRGRGAPSVPSTLFTPEVQRGRGATSVPQHTHTHTMFTVGYKEGKKQLRPSIQRCPRPSTHPHFP